MARKIKNCSITTESKVIELQGDIRAWLVENAPETVDTLLAFTLNGLIWGKLAKGQLMIAHDVEKKYSPELDLDILQEARLFGKSAELHLWRCDDEWRCRITSDDEKGNGRQFIEEQQMLWGDQPETTDNDGFTLMSDGVQGLYHAVPIKVPEPTNEQAQESKPNQYKEQPLRLTVRHYLADEPFGRVEFSRLVSLCVNGKDCDQNGKKE